MAWGKAIVECCLESVNTDVFGFSQISNKIFKYYWNQTIFFDLEQGPDPKKPPEFVSYVKKEIKVYQTIYGFQPIEFERIENKVRLETNKMNQFLKKDVSWRFLNLDEKKMPLYELNLDELNVKVYDIETIKDFSDLLFEVINYKWAQMLETYNSSPRISKKIKVTDRGGVKRKSLSKFKKYLDLDTLECFICSKSLGDDKSIDHVIPWSYLFSDDLWNLVYVHKGCNSSKSNRIVDESIIEKLKCRNNRLLEKLEDCGMQEDNLYKELKLAIDMELVRKFWIGFKG